MWSCCWLKEGGAAAYLVHIIASVLGVVFLRYSWLVSVPTAIVFYATLMRVWVLRVHPAAGPGPGAALGTTAGRLWDEVGAAATPTPGL